MRNFIQAENFKNSYLPRLRTKHQRQIDFWHQFNNEQVNDMVTLNGRYNVEVIFTPEDTWFTIDAINVCDGALSYSVDFDMPFQQGNVYQDAENYLNEHPLEYKTY